MRPQQPIIIPQRVTVPTSDTLRLEDISCEACGLVPNAGDTIYLFTPDLDAAAIFYCDDCYRGFSTSLPAQEGNQP